MCLESEGKCIIWTTFIDELRAFLGICILMGMNRLPATTDYWSTDPIFHYFPVASLNISDLQFVEISMIHTRGEEGYNTLAKIQPIIDKVSRKTSSSVLRQLLHLTKTHNCLSYKR